MTDAKHMTDREIHELLLFHGYDVPMIVIGSWPVRSPFGKPRAVSRVRVVAWLRQTENPRRRAIKVAFPQVLARFDTNITRRLECLK